MAFGSVGDISRLWVNGYMEIPIMSAFGETVKDTLKGYVCYYTRSKTPDLGSIFIQWL